LSKKHKSYDLSVLTVLTVFTSIFPMKNGNFFSDITEYNKRKTMAGKMATVLTRAKVLFFQKESDFRSFRKKSKSLVGRIGRIKITIFDVDGERERDKVANGGS